jgi:hypothetical protein
LTGKRFKKYQNTSIMAYERTLYPNCFNTQNNYFIIQKIINKIKDGVNKKSLTEEVRERLQNENDGAGVDIDIDWAFGGIEIVNIITDIFKIENQGLLREDVSFTAEYNIQQLLEDKENLNNLKLREIHNRCCLFNIIDAFLKYPSEKNYSTIKELKIGIEQKQEKYNNSEKAYEELRKKESAIIYKQHYIYKTKNTYAYDIEPKKEIRKIWEKGLFDEMKGKKREEKIKRFVCCPDERMKILEDLITVIDKKLGEKKYEMKELEREINEDKKKLEILKFKKQYIEPINENRREQYRDLRTLLLKLNSPSLRHLERYYKFKKYEKYLSDPILLYKCTRQDWMNIYYADC